MYKINGSVFVSLELFDEYIEQFREERVPLPKHVYKRIKEERNKKNQ